MGSMLAGMTIFCLRHPEILSKVMERAYFDWQSNFYIGKTTLPYIGVVIWKCRLIFLGRLTNLLSDQ